MFGLCSFGEKSRSVLPLESVHIDVVILSDFCCEVVLNQVFKNPSFVSQIFSIWPIYMIFMGDEKWYGTF